MIEGRVELNFTFSSSYPIPATDPQAYFVWEGTDLTLSCSYTNDVDSMYEPLMVIARETATSQQTNLITYTVDIDDPAATTLVCASGENWSGACDAAERGENDNKFEGSLTITNTETYDESVETGLFQCRVNLFMDGYNSKDIDFTGKRHKFEIS